MSASEPPPEQAANLDVLPYHVALCDFLKRADPDVWSLLASAISRKAQTDAIKFELLKSTYRVERDSQAELYQAAERVAGRLGLSSPITIYQSQNPSGLNASLAYVPAEIHLIFHGPILGQLTPVEVEGLIGHELSHYLLWQKDNGELLVAAEMLTALVNDRSAHSAHFASWRLFQLYSEIFCDRGALMVTNDAQAVVSMLVKVQTGIQDVSAEAYLRQAEEVFAHPDAKADALTHPEAYIRARAVKLWADKHSDAPALIDKMIVGSADMDDLDLLGQDRLQRQTRRFLDVLLSSKWFQTDLVVAHARLFYENYAPPEATVTDADLVKELSVATPSVRDYFCFLLLDFVTTDRGLEELPLALALEVAERVGIKTRFFELACQELRLRKNQVEKVDRDKQQILIEAGKTLLAES
jgi:hypothetical protein